MNSYLYSYDKIIKLISAERFNTYVEMADYDLELAASFYYQNLNRASSFYCKFHWLELALRNSINVHLIKSYGNEWYTSSKINFGDVEASKIKQAFKLLNNEGKVISSSTIVSSLTLGFWVNLFNGRYDNLWRTCLRKSFSTKKIKLQRKELSVRLRRLLKLRNRIAHYEPIINYNLIEYDNNISEVLSWLGC